MAEVARPSRWAAARVDLDAVAHNVAVMRRVTAPAAVWAVVKADAYGHGSVPVAKAVLHAGAEGLCVALVEEGVELREAGIDAPILVLSQQPPEQLGALVAHRLLPTLYSREAVAAVAAEVRAQRRVGFPVHVKVDTGMHRVGAAPSDIPAIVGAVEAAEPTLRLAGIYTHLAMGDVPDDPFTGIQLDRFDATVGALATVPPYVHAANSGGALANPASHYDFVRAGITLYGIAPGPALRHRCTELRPALSLVARVSYVKRVAAGERISYGLTHTFDRDTTVATVPIGYADGVPRRLANAEGLVLLGGRRRRIVGVVTMDQLMLDCGDDPVEVGDEVVLIGEQGGERVRAEDWAQYLGTIGYEIVCGIGKRVPREYTGGG